MRHSHRSLVPIRSRRADYSIVLITNASDWEIRSFIRANQYLGAAHIFIYLDRPYDRSLFDGFENISQLETKQLYEGSERPNFYDLQRQVYADAYARCSTSWLAVFDSDEVLFHPKMPMARFLKKVPVNCNYIPAPVFECFWENAAHTHTPFSATHARQPHAVQKASGYRRKIFGDATEFSTRGCLAGHALGKYLVRKGLALQPDIHRPVPQPETIIVPLKKNLPGLLHYDAVNYSVWFKKFGAGRGVNNGSKTTRNRAALAGDLSADPASAGNRHIFESLFVWPSHIQKRFGRRRIRPLSWQWAALLNSGSIGRRARWTNRIRWVWDRLSFAVRTRWGNLT